MITDGADKYGFLKQYFIKSYLSNNVPLMSSNLFEEKSVFIRSIRLNPRSIYFNCVLFFLVLLN